MAQDHDNMARALQSRRGKGMDISIMLSGAAPHPDGNHVASTGSASPDAPKIAGADEETKRSDLAPAPSHPLSSGPEGVPMGQLDANDLHKQHDLSTLKDGDLMSGMSTHDAADMQDREPRSLGERARQEMTKKMALLKK